MKLGAQSQRFENLEAVIAETKPVGWKFIDPAEGVVRACKAASPSTLLVARVFTGPPEFHNAASHPDAIAYGREYAQRVDRTLAPMHQFLDYVEAENEPVVFNVEVAQRLAEFTVGFAEECQRLGWSPIACNFSEGQPQVYVPGTDYQLDFAIWNVLVPALRVVKRTGGALGLHEYSAPRMKDGWSDAKRLGYRVGRYRAVYAGFPAELKDLPLMLTEYGIDWLINPFHELGGWAHRGGTIAQFLDDLAWANTMLEGDPQVLAAFIYGFQMFAPDWEEYDLARTTESRAAFVDFLKSAAATQPVTTTRTPDVAPSSGPESVMEPRVDKTIEQPADSRPASQPEQVPPQVLDPVETAILHELVNRRQVRFNPEAALFKAAVAARIGLPVGDEQRIEVGGASYAFQQFDDGFVYAKVGEWDRLKVVRTRR